MSHTNPRVLLVDDSKTQQALLKKVLTEGGQMQIVGTADNGPDAVRLTEELTPDVVVMDVQMPGMDGFEATRAIMKRSPTPIVICTSTMDPGEVDISMQALASGALIALQKPPGPADLDYRSEARSFRRMIRLMSDVTVARRRFDGKRTLTRPDTEIAPLPQPPEIVAIASSTGGPAALQAVLTPLPASFPVPIVVVQHIAEGFADGLARWLNSVVDLNVRVATNRERAEPGSVYLAPDNGHLVVARRKRLLVKQTEAINGFRPSADALFESVANQFGKAALAVILTGMGEDGTRGLRQLHLAGGTIIAQNQESSVVWSMPRAACEEGLASEVLDINEIGAAILMSFPVD